VRKLVFLSFLTARGTDVNHNGERDISFAGTEGLFDRERKVGYNDKEGCGAVRWNCPRLK
jgi:hypothetical protein